MKQNQKAMMPLQVVITAIILLVVLFIILYTFTDLFGKEKESISETLTSVTQDWDCDGVYDFYDKCPCDADAEFIESECKGGQQPNKPKWCAGQDKKC